MGYEKINPEYIVVSWSMEVQKEEGREGGKERDRRAKEEVKGHRGQPESAYNRQRTTVAKI